MAYFERISTRKQRSNIIQVGYCYSANTLDLELALEIHRSEILLCMNTSFLSIKYLIAKIRNSIVIDHSMALQWYS